MGKFHVFNTISRKLEEFVPFYEKGEKDFVGMYSCGPTVYGDPHVGNLRAVLLADMLRLVLRHACGYPVKAVMNVTDVGHLTSDGDTGEDKLEKGSKRDGKSAWDVAKHYEEVFVSAIRELGVAPFDAMPRATEHIRQQIEMVEALVAKGYTYGIPGDGIYMDTSKVEDYGRTLGPNFRKHIEGLRAGARVDVEGKKNPTDFALWKFSPAGEKRQMEWDSPWGVGFPGWHIECSAMSRAHLGNRFDLHTGGADHVAVHHPNEIAQSECALGFGPSKPWVPYWAYVQFLNLGGEKIAKSAGNVATMADVLAKGFSGRDLRYFFLSAHYRAYADFTWDNVKGAADARAALARKCADLAASLPEAERAAALALDYSLPAPKFAAAIPEGARAGFEALLAPAFDDLDTPKLLISLQTELSAPKGAATLAAALWLDRNLLKLGAWEKISAPAEEAPAEVRALAEARLAARAAKNWAESDRLRGEMEKLGWTAKDGKDGSALLKK